MSFYKNIGEVFKAEDEIKFNNQRGYKIGDIGWFELNGYRYLFECQHSTCPDIYNSRGEFEELGQCRGCIFHHTVDSLTGRQACELKKPLCPMDQTFIEILRAKIDK